ncbi:MAG: MoxR family ATPase [Candidatus Babeliaceae bacterium]|jgi:MoxR-like ATPase
MNNTPIHENWSKNGLVIDEIKEVSAHFKNIAKEVSKVIIGQDQTITFILIAILSKGHILLEGVPGVAKTTMIKAITQALGLCFKRIQFTPDLLPADLIGTLMYNPKTQEFETKKGPIFANLILADEINRAPAKVQSALLECMQEHQVTLGSQTHHLDEPFLVFATQNPLEQTGTYRLPEAQLDRFMFKILVGYPSMQEEKAIITRAYTQQTVYQVISHADIIKAQNLVEHIYCDERIIDYIIALVCATRTPEKYHLDLKKFIQMGASPRATLAIHQSARAYAFLKKERAFVTPDDVKAVYPAVMRHRIALSYEAEAQGITADAIIDKIMSIIPSP